MDNAARPVNTPKQTPKRQHYTPAFYLRRWSGDDGKVHVVRNFEGRIDRKFRAAKYLGFEKHLYSYSEDFAAIDRAEVETQFLAPLDNQGARIVAEMIAGGQLEMRDYILWAQFLTTMKVRTPENVKKIAIAGSEAIVREMRSAQPEYVAIRGETDPATALDWLKLNRPGLIESFGVKQLPKIASNSRAMQDVMSFSWHIVTFERSSKILMTSDRPCLYTEGLDKPNCIIALPLSPRHAFFAFRSGSLAQRGLMNAPISKLAARLNESVVGQAVLRAYCQRESDAPDGFFARCLSSTAASQQRVAC
jgi:hypothetical protein